MTSTNDAWSQPFQRTKKAASSNTGCFANKRQERGVAMNLGERCDLLLAAGRELLVNGQATDHTVAATEQLGRALDMGAELILKDRLVVSCSTFRNLSFAARHS